MRLRHLIFLICFLCSVIPLLANMSINLPDVLKRFEEAANLEVKLEIANTVNQLNSLIEKRKESVRILCMTQGAVKLSLPNQDDDVVEAIGSQFLAVINKVFAYDQDVKSLTVLDLNGKAVKSFERIGSSALLPVKQIQTFPIRSGLCSLNRQHDMVSVCISTDVNSYSDEKHNKTGKEYLAFLGEIRATDDSLQGYIYLVIDITRLLSQFSENYFAVGDDGRYLSSNGVGKANALDKRDLFSDFPELKYVTPDRLPLVLKDGKTGGRIAWFMFLPDIPVEYNLFIGHRLHEAGIEQWQTTLRIRMLYSLLVILIAAMVIARCVSVYTDRIKNSLTAAFSRLLTDKLPFALNWHWPLELKNLADELNQLSSRYVEAEQAKSAAEDELRKTACALSSSNQELEQFAYVVSHDLQEPLRTIAGYLRLLDKRYNDQLDHKANEFITYSVQAAQRMHNLIQALLAYSRVTTRAKPVNPVDCGAVVDIVLSNLKAIATETSAVITRDEMPVLMADHIQLGQLFQNLIGNAIKFRGDKTPEIHISCRKDAELGWIFSVKDNGIGIDTKYFERIFVVFQRLHTRDKYAGTGIGLAICKKIVERHGGRIWVESAPGYGTTFYFNIPEYQTEGLKKYCEI